MIADWLASLWEWSSVATVAIGVAVATIVVAVIDALRLGRAAFSAAGRSQVAWLLMFAVIGPFAVLLYAAAVRPQVAHPERFVDDVFDDVFADGALAEPGTSR